MRTLTEATYWVRLYSSGPIETAKNVCREFCLRGLCVTIEPTTFIYTGGEEQGFVIGLLQYPRFPAEQERIYGTARDLAQAILEGCFQHSILLMSPDTTEWITVREDGR